MNKCIEYVSFDLLIIAVKPISKKSYFASKVSVFEELFENNMVNNDNLIEKKPVKF